MKHFVADPSPLLPEEASKNEEDPMEIFDRNCKANSLTMRADPDKDGNCFFQAVANQLDRLNMPQHSSYNNTKTCAKQLRHQLVEYMRNTPDIKVSDTMNIIVSLK